MQYMYFGPLHWLLQARTRCVVEKSTSRRGWSWDMHVYVEMFMNDDNNEMCPVNLMVEEVWIGIQGLTSLDPTY